MAKRTVLAENLVEGGSMKNMSQDSHYRTGELEPKRAARLPHGLMAAILMVGLHALWSVWLSAPSPSNGSRVTAGPQIRFLPEVTQSRSPIFAPTVFALPTREGFSGHALTNRFEVAPEIRVPSGEIRYLEWSAPAPRGLATWDAAAPRLPPSPIPRMASSKVADESSAPAVAAGLQVSARNGLVLDEVNMGGLSDAPARVDGWKMAIRVDFDERGQAAHVLLESSSGEPALDREVIRWVKGWTRSPGVEPGGGVVDVAHVPVSAVDEGGAP